MAGTKYGSFAVGDANIDNVMLNLAGINTGYCALTLTEMTTTNVPQIAAGSKIEVGGSLFKFDSNETITGSATTGTNYIRLVPSGSSITAEWTTTAPTWSDSKQGWYDSTGAYRYWEGNVYYNGGQYTKKTPHDRRGSILSNVTNITSGTVELGTVELGTTVINEAQITQGAYDGNALSILTGKTSPFSFYLKYPVSAHIRCGITDSIYIKYDYPGSGTNANVINYATPQALTTQYVALNPGHYVVTWSGAELYLAHPFGLYKNYTESDIIV